jgi:hypothetical protein
MSPAARLGSAGQSSAISGRPISPVAWMGRDPSPLPHGLSEGFVDGSDSALWAKLNPTGSLLGARYRSLALLAGP